MSEFTFPDLKGIRADYDRDGFVIVRDVLPADLLREVDRHIDWLHGSDPNESNAWRRGGSIQYIPATTRVTREWPCLFLFRGDPVEGINTYRKFPAYEAGKHMAFRGCEAWT